MCVPAKQSTMDRTQQLSAEQSLCCLQALGGQRFSFPVSCTNCCIDSKMLLFWCNFISVSSQHLGIWVNFQTDRNINLRTNFICSVPTSASMVLCLLTWDLTLTALIYRKCGLMVKHSSRSLEVWALFLALPCIYWVAFGQISSGGLSSPICEMGIVILDNS